MRRRAQSFLDLLANPSAWDLRVRMGTMAKVRQGIMFPHPENLNDGLCSV